MQSLLHRIRNCASVGIQNANSKGNRKTSHNTSQNPMATKKRYLIVIIIREKRVDIFISFWTRENLFTFFWFRERFVVILWAYSKTVKLFMDDKTLSSRQKTLKKLYTDVGWVVQNSRFDSCTPGVHIILCTFSIEDLSKNF